MTGTAFLTAESAPVSDESASSAAVPPRLEAWQLVDLGAGHADRQEEHDVFLRQRGLAGHVEAQVVGVAVGVKGDAPDAAGAAAAAGRAVRAGGARCAELRPNSGGTR